MITYENLRSFCYSNDKEIEGPIRGLQVSFMGLGSQRMLESPMDNSDELAQKGIIYLMPYLNPWAWMNKMAVRTADEIIDAIKEHYGLPDLPVASTGGSMGGQSALVFCRYSHQNIVSCCTVCPVCDVPYHFTERPDLPRTMYSAFGDAPDFEAELRARSPLHLAASLPDIPYTFFHTAGDSQVGKKAHSDKMVAALRACGRTVTYHEFPEGGHCELGPEGAKLYNAECMKYLV